MVYDMIQQDIDKSHAYVNGFESCHICPIAMMMKRNGYEKVSIGSNEMELDGKRYICDSTIREWIADLMDGYGQELITVELVECDGKSGYATIV